MNQARLLKKGRQHGFSLIELMIVIAIIGLLIGVGVPAWQFMVRNGNHTAAAQSLQQISTNQVSYRSLKGSFADNFDELIKETGFNDAFKSAAGAKPTVNGYIYDLKVNKSSNGKNTSYSVNADPEGTASGTRHFYIDSERGNIRFNDQGPADANSPVLQN